MRKPDDHLRLSVKILFYSGVALILGASLPLFGIYGSMMITGFMLILAAVLASRNG